MNRFTATLITLNEEQNLPRVLASLKNIADEIVVLDAGSTDRTRELAEKSGARVFVREWTDYSNQRNFAAAQASHDWIFTIDADEELSEELRKSLAAWKQSEAKNAGYQVSRLANYLGRWIHHSGWYPDLNVRLYRRDRARYEGAIHERMVVDGSVGRLEGDLLHYAYRTAEEHAAKVEAYSSLAAEQFFNRGRRRWRAAMIVAPPWALVRAYVFQQGFRDGGHGWKIAKSSARYVKMKYRKLGVLVSGGTLERRKAAPGG
jgi:glycosyltransferase involved in cell wall biosynthesis